MSDHVHQGDFYEPDEPIEDIVAAWDQSTEGGVTAVPCEFTAEVVATFGSATVIVQSLHQVLVGDGSVGTSTHSGYARAS